MRRNSKALVIAQTQKAMTVSREVKRGFVVSSYMLWPYGGSAYARSIVSAAAAREKRG